MEKLSPFRKANKIRNATQSLKHPEISNVALSFRDRK